jgi:hypothetical protein
MPAAGRDQLTSYSSAFHDEIPTLCRVQTSRPAVDRDTLEPAVSELHIVTLPSSLSEIASHGLPALRTRRELWYHSLNTQPSMPPWINASGGALSMRCTRTVRLRLPREELISFPSQQKAPKASITAEHRSDFCFHSQLLRSGSRLTEERTA